jgi:hypothetical protein
MKKQNLVYPEGINLRLIPEQRSDVGVANRASRKMPELDVGVANARNWNGHERPSRRSDCQLRKDIACLVFREQSSFFSEL